LPATPSAGAGLQTAADGDDAASIVGLWHTVYTSGGMTAFESFEQWHADGNEFEGSDLQLGSICQGTWKKIGSRTIKLFHVGWDFDPTGVTLTGHFTEIQTINLSADGKTYDGTFSLRNVDLMGNPAPQLGDMDGTVHSTRLTVP
jgi:hypothetical protein